MGINRHGTGAVWVFVILQRKPIRNRGLFGIRMHVFKADDVGFLVLKIKAVCNINLSDGLYFVVE